MVNHSTVIAQAVVATVLFTFYLGGDSRTMISFEGQLQEWSFSNYVELLSLQNAIGQLVIYFLILEPDDNFEYLSL
jgi:hypothetical protein